MKKLTKICKILLYFTAANFSITRLTEITFSITLDKKRLWKSNPGIILTSDNIICKDQSLS